MLKFQEESRVRTSKIKVRSASSFRILNVVSILLVLLIASGVMSQEVPAESGTRADERPIRTLRDLNQAFVDIVSKVKPAVVTVSTERIIYVRPMSPFSGDPFFRFFFGPQGRQAPEQEYRQRGLGSGVIVSADGHILTNNHVIENADSIFVRTYDGERFTAQVVGTDPQTDIAVIKIDDSNLHFINIGNSDALQVGEIVLAVGSPMSENLAYTVTQGIVSAKGRADVGLATYEDFIQTDAAINPGNSGGPLVNLDGELVGINAAIVSQTGGFQGIGFAVPSNMAVRVMNSLITEGRVSRAWLGINIQDVNEQIAGAMGLDEPVGALIGDVVSGSPADKAGLQPGDIVLDFSGRRIENAHELRSLIGSSPPGKSLT
jgi:serine protease Do